jgi:hypothetical protein
MSPKRFVIGFYNSVFKGAVMVGWWCFVNWWRSVYMLWHCGGSNESLIRLRAQETAAGTIFELHDKYNLHLILEYLINNGVQTQNFLMIASLFFVLCEELNKCYADVSFNESKNEWNFIPVLMLKVISLITSAEVQKAWVYTTTPRTLHGTVLN